MTDLIQRLRAATGPDRELDAEIYRFIPVSDRQHLVVVPAYTASLDAAITLIPDGLDWEVKTAPHRKGAIARVVSMDATFWAEAATPALALTIAALLARGLTERAGGG
jgi:hypothetical protein